MCGRTIERYNNRHLFLHVILFDALLFFCHKSEVEKVVLFDAPVNPTATTKKGLLEILTADGLLQCLGYVHTHNKTKSS